MSDLPLNDRLLNLQEFRRLVPVGNTKLFDLIGQNVIARVKIGRRTFIRESEAKRFLASLSTERA